MLLVYVLRICGISSFLLTSHFLPGRPPDSNADPAIYDLFAAARQLRQVLYRRYLFEHFLTSGPDVKAIGRRAYLRTVIFGSFGSVLVPSLVSPQQTGVSSPSPKGSRFSTRRLVCIACGNCSHSDECKELSRPSKEWNCLAGRLAKNLAVRSR